MTIDKRLLSLFISFLLISCGQKDDKTTSDAIKVPTFSKEQLQKDFDVFRTSFEEMHSGLYSFISKDSLDYYFNDSYSKIKSEMTKDEFFTLLSPIIRKIYDEHISLGFWYKYADIKKFMPIKVRWLDNIPYIHKNLLNDPNVILGSQIVSINGRNPLDIYKTVKATYPNFTTDESLEYDVYSLHFDYLYSSFIEQPDSFHIVAIDPNTKKEYSFHLPCVLPSDSIHFLPLQKFATEYINTDTCYKFKIDKENNIALMKISTFWETGGINFSEAFKKDFKSISDNKINNLIIDLRYNRGGDPKFGGILLSYLCNKPFQIFDSMSATIKKRPTYYNLMDSTGLSLKDWNSTIVALTNLPKKNANYYTSFRDTIFTPKSNQFKGNIYLLINSDIHSGALITATLLDYYTNAKTIGTPICGPYNSGNALDAIPLTLPNTKIEVVIPIVHYSYSVPDNLYPYKKGTIPDTIIKPTITDIINKKDNILEATIKMTKTH